MDKELDFPKQSNEEFIKSLQKKEKRKEEIFELLEKNKEDKIKRPKAFLKVEQQLNEELFKMKISDTKGFILVNFPNNYNQAKILEKRLSGYIPDNEKKINELEFVQKNFDVYLDKSFKMQEKKGLIKGGLDYVFYLNSDYFECVRRCFGIRLHPQSFKIYHLEDNPPNRKFYIENKNENKISYSQRATNRSSNPVSINNRTRYNTAIKTTINNDNSINDNEHLNNTDERLYTEYTDKLSHNYQMDHNHYFNLNINKFERNFIVKMNELVCENLITLDTISLSEAQSAIKYISFQNNLIHIIEFYEKFGFENTAEKLLQIFESNNSFRIITEQLTNKINKLGEDNEKRYEDIFKKFIMENNEENSSNSILKSISDAPLLDNNPNNELLLNKSLNRSSAISSLDKNFINPHNNINLLNNEINKNYNNNNDNDNNQKVEELNLGNGISEKDKPDQDIEAIKFLEKIEKMKNSINKEIADILFAIWKRLYENYSSGLKMTFKSFRNQRDSISNYYNILSQKFIDYLKRPSVKQRYVLDYQIKFNKFHDDFPDLIDDNQVKEEFHQVIEDLIDKVIEINHMRKNEALQERSQIIQSNWIENEMEKFYFNLEYLFQLEADKFLGSLQIIYDFYSCLNNQNMITNPIYSYDIISEESVSLIYIKNLY